MTRPAAIGALAAIALAAGTARAAPAVSGIDGRLADTERSLLELAPVILSTERLNTRQSEALAALELERRYSEAELQFLIGEYGKAAAALQDLVETPRFRGGERMPAARYYLAESLYQQRNFRGARRYLRDLLLAGQGPEVDLALPRFLELCGRLDDFTGVDEVFAAVRAGQGARSQERTYAVGKGMFRRTDLPDEQRLRRAEELFASLRRGRYEARALYFLGVIAVQRRQLDRAAEQFLAAIAAAPADEIELRELGELAVARVYHEQKKWKEALERYRKFGPKSKHHAEALEETAWTHAAMGDFEGALRAADLSLVVAKGTPREPEAKLLQAHFCAKSGRHAEAAKLYGEVAKELGPVRDRVAEVLRRHADPAAYFDRQLQGKSEVDAKELLPAEALAFADPGPEVDRALSVVRDLAESRRALAEARELAKALLAKLASEDGLEASPGLADGISRADRALVRLIAAKRELDGVEASMAGGRVPPELAEVRAEASAIEGRFVAAVAEDPARLRRVALLEEVDASIAGLGAEVETLDGRLRALRAWAANPRRRRTAGSGEVELARGLPEEQARSARLRAGYEELRRRVDDELAREGAGDGEAEELQRRYQGVLARERELAARVRTGLPPAVAARLEAAHRGIDEARIRLLASRRRMAELARRRGAELREAVAVEARRLDLEQAQLDAVAGEAGGLVGRMALSSVRRVWKGLDDLAVQADAGLADVAWTEKHQRSDAIKSLAEEKDRAIGDLEADHAGRAGPAGAKP